jgi:WD40-like Beta Propeller Repeat
MLRKQSIAALVIGAICSTWAQTESTEPDKPSCSDAARDAELAKQVTPLVDAFLNNAGVLTPDGKRLVFLSNRDGIDQLYVADATKADSPATRLSRGLGRFCISQWAYDGGVRNRRARKAFLVGAGPSGVPY